MRACTWRGDCDRIRFCLVARFFSFPLFDFFLLLIRVKKSPFKTHQSMYTPINRILNIYIYIHTRARVHILRAKEKKFSRNPFFFLLFFFGVMPPHAIGHTQSSLPLVFHYYTCSEGEFPWHARKLSYFFFLPLLIFVEISSAEVVFWHCIPRDFQWRINRRLLYFSNWQQTTCVCVCVNKIKITHFY